MILGTGGTPDRCRGSGRIPARWTKNDGPATRCRSPAAASSNDPRWRWPAARCSRARAARSIPNVSDTTAAIQTRWPIKRVVYVMLENRSFDNLFGRFPGVEGTTIGVLDGAEVPLKRCPDWLPGDLPHDRAAALNCWNGGKQDGFGTARLRRSVGLHAVRRERGAQLLALGPGVRDVGPLLRLRDGPVVPEPLLLHRRLLGRFDRQPGEHRDPPDVERRQALQELGMRRGRRRHLRVHAGRRGPPVEAFVVLRVPARSASSSPTKGVDWTFYARRRASPGTSGTPTTACRRSSTRTCSRAHARRRER